MFFVIHSDACFWMFAACIRRLLGGSCYFMFRQQYRTVKTVTFEKDFSKNHLL